MAAAALSRSRGVAGVTTTRGLFFIFSLLCLVCLASSFIDKDTLERQKEDLQKAEQQLESVKKRRDTTLEFTNEFLNHLEPLIAVAKKTSVFVELDGLLEKIKDTMQKSKELFEGFGAEMENNEHKLRKHKKFINFLEELQAEL